MLGMQKRVVCEREREMAARGGTTTTAPFGGRAHKRAVGAPNARAKCTSAYFSHKSDAPSGDAAAVTRGEESALLLLVQKKGRRRTTRRESPRRRHDGRG
jgi:hypothetical protein